MACEDGGGIVLSVAEVDPKTRFPRFLFPLFLPPTTYLLLPSDTTFTPRRSVRSLSLPPTISFTQLSRESDSNIGSPLQRDDSQEPSKGQLLARYLMRTSRIADGGQGATHDICIDVHICIPRHLSPLMTHCACPPAPGNRSTRRSCVCDVIDYMILSSETYLVVRECEESKREAREPRERRESRESLERV